MDFPILHPREIDLIAMPAVSNFCYLVAFGEQKGGLDTPILGPSSLLNSVGYARLNLALANSEYLDAHVFSPKRLFIQVEVFGRVCLNHGLDIFFRNAKV